MDFKYKKLDKIFNDIITYVWRSNMSDIHEFIIQKINGKYYVKSEDGKKNLGGPYKTKKEAEDRLRQVDYFKKKKSKSLRETIKDRLNDIVNEK